MEWLVLIAFVGFAALLIGFPWRGGTTPTRDEAELNGLWQERERLLEELRDLDNDAATGRLSAAGRAQGGRAAASRSDRGPAKPRHRPDRGSVRTGVRSARRRVNLASTGRLGVRTLVLVLLVAVVGPSTILAPHAAAQDAAGSISGTVRLGTAGSEPTSGVRVQLIELGADGSLTTQEQDVVGGAFSFAVAADTARSYVLRTQYEGVQYLSDPILLSEDFPTAQVELVVYTTTRERPALVLDLSVLTVIAIDRQNAQLTLIREDLVINPTDRVYIGDEGGVTLRLPLPERTLSADGLSDEGTFTVDGGVLATTAFIRPGATLVVTRYIVGYDRAADAYDLRLTAPVPAQQTEIHVPERFIEALEPLDGAVRAPNAEFEGEQLLVVALDGPARDGQSVRARMKGISGRNESNPLTDQPGAIIAVILAAALLAGAVAGIALLSRERAETGAA